MERQEYVCFSIAHRGPVHGYHKAGLHSCFSLLSPKSMGTTSAGHPGHASHAQHPCHHCQAVPWGISSPHLSLQCTSTSGIRKRSSRQAFLGRGEDLPQGAGVLESFRGAPRLCGMSCCSVPTWLPPALLPVPRQSRDLQMLACAHGAAGQGMKCTQCTKSQPCPQGKDRHKNKGNQKHRTLRP